MSQVSHVFTGLRGSSGLVQDNSHSAGLPQLRLAQIPSSGPGCKGILVVHPYPFISTRAYSRIMVRKLVLIRHAKAQHSNSLGDHARELSVRGQDQAEQLGKFLADTYGSIDLAYVSTAARATQTWLGASKSCSAQRAEELKAIYTTGAEGLLEILRQSDDQAEVVILVGHEPTISALAWNLSVVESPAVGEVTHGMSTCSAACLEWDGAWSDLTEESAVLTQVWQPAHRPR